MGTHPRQRNKEGAVAKGQSHCSFPHVLVYGWVYISHASSFALYLLEMFVDVSVSFT